MTRFFVTAEEMQPNFLVLTGENAQHAKVLRLKIGEEVLVCDGEGHECLCAVSDVSPDRISLVVKNRMDSQSEAPVRVSIYMAFPKGDKLEHVIQKATELGAYEIVAFPSARCVSKPDEKSLKKKVERWQKIVASAAEQSGLSKKDTERVLNAAIDTIVASLAKGERVQISGFGIFEAKEREARVGRNPRTKETIEIPATRTPAFKASKALKDTVAK